MIIVPYAVGAAAPMEIAQAAQPYGGAIFLTASTDPLIEPAVKVLTEFGPVVGAPEGMAALDLALNGRQAHGVVTFADPMLPVATAVARHLGLPGHEEGTCELLRDKAAQRQRLNECGAGYVPAAAFSTPHQQAAGQPAPQPPAKVAAMEFPLIVKPRTGAGSQYTLLVPDRDALPAQLAQLPAGQAFVAERFIPSRPRDSQASPADNWLADYLSVESAVTGSGIRHLAVTGRLPLTEPARETGAVVPAPLDAGLQAGVHGLAEAAIRALGISLGLVHTEIKLSPDGPQVIEVNGRLGGTIGQLMRAVGLPDPVELAVGLAAGAPLPAESPPARGYALVFWLQPPLAAVSMAQGPPPRDIGRRPGVVRVQQSRRAGQPTHWSEGTASMIYEVTLINDELDGLRRDVDDLRAYFDDTVTWEYR